MSPSRIINAVCDTAMIVSGIMLIGMILVVFAKIFTTMLPFLSNPMTLIIAANISIIFYICYKYPQKVRDFFMGRSFW